MAHDLVTELLQYSSLACFIPIWQLCANLLIPNCLRSNLSYSPLAALELYVNKYNSLKNYGDMIVFIENGKVIHQIGRTYFDERAVLREFCMLRGQEWDDEEEIMDDYC